MALTYFQLKSTSPAPVEKTKLKTTKYKRPAFENPSFFPSYNIIIILSNLLGVSGIHVLYVMSVM